jgi:fibronectin-binding autotransporter adhesin
MSQSGMDNARLGPIGRLVSQPRFPKRGYNIGVAIGGAVCAAAVLSFAPPALAAIGSGSTALASGLGTGAIAFQGGTLKIDQTGTYSNNFTLQGSSSATITNTIDAAGNVGTFSGIYSDDSTSSFPGGLTITDSAGGGKVIFSGANTYIGPTTINTGATVALSGTGTIAASGSLTDNGTFDISQATSGASITSLAGSGSVILGAQTLTVTNGSGTFTGAVSGTGGLVVNGGTLVLDGTNSYTGGTTISRGTLQLGAGDSSGSITGNVANVGTLAFDRADDITFIGMISGTGAVSQLGGGTLTLTTAEPYSGVTTISSGTLALSGSGSIVNSNSVAAFGTFDISATAGASIKSLSGSGNVQLGGQTLTLTSASGTFSGVIAGSGGVVLNGGTEILSGANTYTGSTIVNGGTLELGAATITNNVTNNANFGFFSGSAIAMSGVISGSGNVIQVGSGVTTVSTAQTYTGTTTISSGTLALSGGGSIAASSNLTDNGAFSIAAATGGVSIVSLSGIGAVQLGAVDLTLSNASGTFSGTISGSGGLILAGGKETLSGGGSFTGATIISSGTLYVSGPSSLSGSARVVDDAVLDISGVTSTGVLTTSSIVSLSGSGSVALGSAILALTNAGDTFSGAISGTGGLAVGGGTETLTGASSYTGGTTITAGTLSLAGAGSLAATGTVADNGIFDISAAGSGGVVTIGSLSGSGTVNLGSNILNLANASTAFSGVITGSGGLLLSAGSETVTGANNYTGGTVINAGTLQIGNGVQNGSIIGNVANNGTLAFDGIGSVVFSGLISGAGNVTQIGTGTTILTAGNTYTGGTVIAAGSLQIGNGGTTGAIVGDVADNGALAFDRSDATIFAGTISGSGSVSQIGSGALTLTAVDSYTGTTTINSGTQLVLSGAGSIASSSSVIDNGTLNISIATTSPTIASLAGTGIVTLGPQSLGLTKAADVFSGSINGTGGLILNGGTETLSGTNSYTGATRINGGILTVNGSITSSSGVTVNSGGTLAGIGTVPAVTVGSGGTLAPGAGTLKVNGGVTFASGSTYLVNLTSTSSPKLVASGAAALAGTLSATSADGTYLLGQKVAVLTADGGLSGSFTLSPLVSTGAQYSGKLSYDANNAYLEIDLAKLSPLLPSGASTNQTNPVNGIDTAIAANDILPLPFENLGNLSPAGLASSADQLSGEIGSDIPQASNALFNPLLDSIFNHLSDVQGNRLASQRSNARSDIQAWASGLVGSSLVAGDADTIGTHKFKSHIAGFVAGADWNISPSLTVGGALSAGHTNFHVAGNLGQGGADAFQAAGYGFAQFSSHLYGSFAAALAVDNITTNRVLTVSGTDDLTGKVNAIVFGGRYETGVNLGWLTPYLALQDELFDVPGYGESASSGASTFALNYQSRTTNSADLEMGARQSTDIALGRIWTLKLTDRLAWAHDMSGRSEAQAGFVALPASDFTTYGATPAKDSALVSLGAQFSNRHGFSLNMHLDSAVAANSQTYTGIAGLNFAW